MAYSAPELLLVGAAQNLVLFTSPTNEVDPCFNTEIEEKRELEYDEGGLW